jgi:hypothetical protein
MRIYLDSNIFQAVKKSENSLLLEAILKDKEYNIYSYSSAHIEDLMKDPTEQKLDDLKFIEFIVDDNCWYYDNKIQFENIPPTEYFGDTFPAFQNNLIDVHEFFNTPIFGVPVKRTLQSTPSLFSVLPREQVFSQDINPLLKEWLSNSKSMFDVLVNFANLTNEMGRNQKSFAKMISATHKLTVDGEFLKSIGIEGFSENMIIDKEAFRSSYANYFLKNRKEMSRNELFKNMYNGLEFLGFVKGKPKKQKMGSLVADSDHAFFGAFNDIVVTNDADMRRKTRFMYDLFNFNTQVLDIHEFHEYLVISKAQRESTFAKMVDEITSLNDLEERIIHQHNEDNKVVITIKLKEIYYQYFNFVSIVENEQSYIYYFGKAINNLSVGTLTKEFKYLTDRLVNELGVDTNQKSYFSANEIDGEKWCGRTWILGNVVVNLIYSGKLFLEIYFITKVQS